MGTGGASKYGTSRRIDVNVASDNRRPPLDLPLAPWC